MGADGWTYLFSKPLLIQYGLFDKFVEELGSLIGQYDNDLLERATKNDIFELITFSPKEGERLDEWIVANDIFSLYVTFGIGGDHDYYDLKLKEYAQSPGIIFNKIKLWT